MIGTVSGLTVGGVPDLKDLIAKVTPYARSLDPMSTDIRPFAHYTPDGRIWGTGVQPVGFTQEWAEEGGLYVVGEVRSVTGTGLYLDYVDWVDGVPKITPKPALTGGFDTLQLEPGQEATFPDLPPATVRFTGPISGEQAHPDAGDFLIGWRVPGTYQVEIDAHPYLILNVTFEVKKP